MEFEEILMSVGGYGKYQKCLILFFMIPFFTVLPLFSMPIIFLTSIPDHWCYVAVIANSNLSVKLQKKLIRPPADPTCSMYNVNYSEMVKTGKWKVDTKASTKPCDEGWQFDKTIYDETATTKWNLVCKDDHFVPLMLSCAFIGVIIGTPFFSLLSSSLGRKPAFMTAAAIIALTDVGSSLCPDFTLVIILRIVEGMGIPTVTREAYIIILELVNPKLHTRINGISTTAWFAGACLVPLLAWWTTHWVKFTAVSSSCAACVLIFGKFLPESPGWLISQRKYKEATDILSSISKFNGKTQYDRFLMLERVTIFGEEYQTKMNREPKTSYQEFFKHKLLRKRFLLIVVCWMCNSVPFFGLQMNTRNLVGNQFINFFLANLIEIPTHFATWLLINVGRKPCLLLSLSLTAVSCLITYPFRNYAEIFIICTILSKMGTCATYMTLYVFGPELFPVALKTKGIIMCGVMGPAAAFFSSYAVLMAKYGQFVTFLIFGTLTCIGTICGCFIPETLGKTLPETVSDAENFERSFGNWCCTAEVNDTESVPTMSMTTPVGFSDPPTEASSERTGDIERLFRNKTLPRLFPW